MKRFVAAAVAATALALVVAAGAGAAGWPSWVPFTNQLASSPVAGGGFPDPSGAPTPGTCTQG